MRVDLVTSPRRCGSRTGRRCGPPPGRAVRRRLAGRPGRRHPRLRVGGRRRPAAAARRAGRGPRPVRGGQRAPRRSSRTSRRWSPCPTAGRLALGSGSTPARMRCVLLSETHGPGRRPRARSTPPSPTRSRVPADQLNLEGAAVVGGRAAVVPAGAAVRRRAQRQRRRRRWTASSPWRPAAPAAVRVVGRTPLRPRDGGRRGARDHRRGRAPGRPGAGQRRGRGQPHRRTTTGRWSAPPWPCSTATGVVDLVELPAARRCGRQGRGAGPGRGTATTCSTWSRSSTPTTRRCRRCCWS